VAGVPPEMAVALTKVKTSFAKGTMAPAGAVPDSNWANVANCTLPNDVVVAGDAPAVVHV